MSTAARRAHTDEESCGYSHVVMTESTSAGPLQSGRCGWPHLCDGLCRGCSLTAIGTEISGRRRSQITNVRPRPDGPASPALPQRACFLRPERKSRTADVRNIPRRSLTRASRPCICEQSRAWFSRALAALRSFRENRMSVPSSAWVNPSTNICGARASAALD